VPKTVPPVRSFPQVSVAHDIIAIEDATRLVAAQFHRNALGDPGADHVPDIAAGLALLSRVHAGATYVGTVLPGVLVFGLGLSLTVAPLTATVLAAAATRYAGVASGVNNAIWRGAGLLAVAVIPGLTGLTGHAARIHARRPRSIGHYCAVDGPALATGHDATKATRSVAAATAPKPSESR